MLEYSFIMRLYSIKNFFNRHWHLFALNLFWYLSLYPGRLGFDNSLALKMIREGESTDWWTGTFWRVLQLTTLNGKTIALLSLLQITLLALSMYYFVGSLTKLDTVLAKRSLFLFTLTPIYGFFALSISHDVFQTSALLLMIGYFIRLRDKITSGFAIEVLLLLLIVLCISMVKTGTFFIIILIIAITIYGSNSKLKVPIVLISSIILLFLPAKGLDSSWTQSGKFTPFLGDMKCIAQHPDSTISIETWNFLESIASKEAWTSPVSCSGLEAAVETLKPRFATMTLDTEFLRNYLKMVYLNPEIFLMGHIVRSREALPPLLFPIPENQVSFDFSQPLGKDTNSALQSGPPLLHPSIDSPELDQRVSLMKPLEVIAQFPAFLVNQASWFWGWAGFWLVVALLSSIKLKLFKNSSTMLFSFLPLLLLHLLIVAIGFNPQGRHLMASIFVGLYLGIYSLAKYLKT